MILVDTAVWIDHLRAGDDDLAELLEHGEVLAHPWVTGELALGNLRARAEILRLLDDLPQAAVAMPAELRAFIDRHALSGAGIGLVDARLLAAAMLTDARLWTRDRQLHAAAKRFGVRLDATDDRMSERRRARDVGRLSGERARPYQMRLSP